MAKRTQYIVFFEEEYNYTISQIKELLAAKYSLTDAKKKAISISFENTTLYIEHKTGQYIEDKASDLAYDYGIEALENSSKGLEFYSEANTNAVAQTDALAVLELLHKELDCIHIFDTEQAYFLWMPLWEPEPGENELELDMSCLEIVPGNQELNGLLTQLQLEPNNADNWTNIAVEYSEIKRNDLALRCCENTIIIDDSNSLAYYNMGVYYAEMENEEAAEKAYKKCLEVDSEYYNAHINLGYLYAKQGKIEDGIAIWEQAIRLDEYDSSAYTPIGFYYLLKGDIEKAIIYIEKAIELGDESHSNLNKGHIHYIRGEQNEAIACYKASKEAFEDDDNFWNSFDSDYELMPQFNISLLDYNALKPLI